MPAASAARSSDRVSSPLTRSDQLTPEQFEDFRAIVASQLGIKMPPEKQVMLQSRLHRRVRELGLGSFTEYHERFFRDGQYEPAELEQFLNLATTNKTDFFREPAHFEVLVRDVLPQWRAHRTRPSFRVWCAGCSSGEEAYTLAMALLEAQAGGAFDFSVLATDVSTRVLQIALAAIYPEEHAQPLPPAWRKRYLLRSRQRDEEKVRVAPEVRERVQFGHLNFLSPDYGIREVMDVVFFRNVLIYFDRPSQETIVGRICRHLRPGGTLFTAHAETLQGLDLPLELVGTACYRRKGTEGRA